MISTWLIVALLFSLFRYLRLIVNCISYLTFKPIPIPDDPTYSSQDVTIILPTIAEGGDELETTIRTCLQSEPLELLIVTVDANVQRLERVAAAINDKKIRVLSIPTANKRRQMCRAIPEVTTKITVFVDDDVIWPKKVLQWILAPFEDPGYGGVGTCQRLKRPEQMNVWAFFNSVYLDRRNFDCGSCLHIDGGLPCLSGRSVAYRSCILQDEQFTHGFTHEEWATCQLNADDDNFITRWLYSHGWKITMQFHRECEIQTSLEASPKYVQQCLRWVRSNWRSNLTSMFQERHYWYSQPWTTYSVLQTTITAWAFPCDCFSFLSWYYATAGWDIASRKALLVFLACWVFFFSKSVKIWGHYLRYPADIVYHPAHVLFGYCHGAIKLYGMLTLNATTWGSRDGADTDDRIRMIRLPAYGSHEPDGRRSHTFDGPEVEENDGLPAYDPFIVKHDTGMPVTRDTTMRSKIDDMHPLLTAEPRLIDFNTQPAAVAVMT